MSLTNAAGGGELCGLCYNKFGAIDTVILECKHKFHFRCMLIHKQRNESNGACPTCNNALPRSEMKHSPVVLERKRQEQYQAQLLNLRVVNTNFSVKFLTICTLISVVLIFVAHYSLHHMHYREIMQTIKNNDTEGFKRMVSKYATEELKEDLLCKVTQRGQLQNMILLINYGVNVFAKNECAIKNAYQGGYTDIVKVLKDYYDNRKK